MTNADQLVCGKCGTPVEHYQNRCPACAASLTGEDDKVLEWKFARGDHRSGQALAVYLFLSALVGALSGFLGTIIVYWKPVTDLLLRLGIYRNLRTEDTTTAIFWRFVLFGILGFLIAFWYFRKINTPRPDDPGKPRN